MQVRECGLFVDIGNGQLAESPDRIATIGGQGVIIQVKSMSSCSTLSPLNAIKLQQGESGFAFRVINSGVSLKEKHPYHYEVQMQMAVTGLRHCHVVVFTSPYHALCICEVGFDRVFWDSMKTKSV